MSSTVMSAIPDWQLPHLYCIPRVDVISLSYWTVNMNDSDCICLISCRYITVIPCFNILFPFAVFFCLYCMDPMSLIITSVVGFPPTIFLLDFDVLVMTSLNLFYVHSNDDLSVCHLCQCAAAILLPV